MDPLRTCLKIFTAEEVSETRNRGDAWPPRKLPSHHQNNIISLYLDHHFHTII